MPREAVNQDPNAKTTNRWLSVLGGAQVGGAVAAGYELAKHGFNAGVQTIPGAVGAGLSLASTGIQIGLFCAHKGSHTGKYLLLSTLNAACAFYGAHRATEEGLSDDIAIAFNVVSAVWYAAQATTSCCITPPQARSPVR